MVDRNVITGIGVILLLSLATRLILISPTGYRSTDFEVHRNWMAITSSIPLSRWYIESTSIWTLDYPPLFAYFEYLISLFGRNPIGSFLFGKPDPLMLDVNSLDYAPIHVINFQRLSVVISDLLVFVPATVLLALSIRGRFKLLSNKPITYTNFDYLIIFLTVSNVGLFVVDHIHFQYNGFLIGVLFLSLASAINGYPLLCAFFFTILVFLKHIFGYMALPMIVFLLQDYCISATLNNQSFRFSFRFSNFLSLSSVALIVASIALFPFVLTGQSKNLVSRLFPLARGLVHSYWAPNAWALYLTADRLLPKVFPELLRPIDGVQLDSGKRGPLVLPPITPRTSLFLTLFLGYFPLLWYMKRRDQQRWAAVKLSGNAPHDAAQSCSNRISIVRQLELPLYVSLGNYAAFMFGFHVHEKAILYSTLPLTIPVYFLGSPQIKKLFLYLNLWSNFSLLPLLPRSSDTLLKLFLWCAYSYFESQVASLDWPSENPSENTSDDLFSIFISLIQSRVFRCIQIVSMVGLIIYQGYWQQCHSLIFSDPNAFEFLPLLLISSISALGIFLHIVILSCRLFSSFDSLIHSNLHFKYD